MQIILKVDLLCIKYHHCIQGKRKSPSPSTNISSNPSTDSASGSSSDKAGAIIVFVSSYRNKPKYLTTELLNDYTDSQAFEEAFA